MQQLYKLNDVAWAAGGNLLFDLSSLPKGKRIRSIYLYFDLSGTKACADALTQDNFARAVSLVQVANFYQLPGEAAYELMKQVRGRGFVGPISAAIPGTGTTFDMEFGLQIPFRDPRQPGSDDGSLPTELVMNRAVEVTMAAAGVWAVGSLVVTAGTIRCSCELVDETHIPQLTRIGYIDPGSQTADLEPGVYKDLFVLDGTANGVITTAEITSVSLEADGQTLINNARAEQLVQAYNESGVEDTDGEQAVNALSRFPLIWHPRRGGNITKQVAVEKQLRVQITGSMTAPRIVYWRAVEKSPDSIGRIAAAVGAPGDTTSYEAQTATKSPLRALERQNELGRLPKKARLASRILPGKFRR